MPGELRVVATAGHVDHGKSSLIERLTGMDPDRWDEEKRRGLTIDLGYAWCTLPGGREVGFVDVPGHHRFISNMLAGVGPLRLVLFVVAADEGWKPQSEEHLQILDVLGVAGGVIALTKADAVDDREVERARREVEERIAGTVLQGAPIVPVSARTRAGLDGLVRELDRMMMGAPVPGAARTRLFVDRVFTITGAGTVVTGTLTGDCLSLGDEVQILPGGGRARIRSMQTHRTSEDRACPVTRVAVNLAGVGRRDLGRGDVIAVPGEWQPTKVFEARLSPVRGASSAVGARGAHLLYVGARETGARIRVYGTSAIEPDSDAFVRIRTDRPLILDVFDRFVLRDAGRGETIAGGVVLDVDPPVRAGGAPARRLAARASASRDRLPELLTQERGAVSASQARLATGSPASGGTPIGGWFVRPDVVAAADRAVGERLADHHRERPLEPGAPLATIRRLIGSTLAGRGVERDPSLIDAIVRDMASRGTIAIEAETVRLAEHQVTVDASSVEVAGVVTAVSGDRTTSPPTVQELVASGVDRDVIDAAVRAGAVVRVSPQLVVAPELVDRAREVVAGASSGVTVSAFREAIGTSRKYAVPLLEHFDRTGVTRRDGDLRFPRADEHPAGR
jgi:selenocysteine-specific elongation factor